MMVTVVDGLLALLPVQFQVLRLKRLHDFFIVYFGQACLEG